MHLTLAEFVCYYDYCGKDESHQLMKILSKPEVDIKASDIRSANSESDNLPEFIVTRANDVMKLRTSKKVLAYPCYDDNPPKLEFTKCLLFVPIADPILDEQTVSRLLADSSELIQDGSSITKLERNERYNLFITYSIIKTDNYRYLFPKKNFHLCKFNSS